MAVITKRVGINMNFVGVFLCYAVLTILSMVYFGASFATAVLFTLLYTVISTAIVFVSALISRAINMHEYS